MKVFQSRSDIFVVILSIIVMVIAGLSGYYLAKNADEKKKPVAEYIETDINDIKQELVTHMEKEMANKLFRGLLHAIKTIRPELDCTIAEKIVNVIIDVCKRKDLDPVLVTSIIAVESMFDPFAKSNKGAIGLMQVRYEVWKHDPILIENNAHKKASLYWIDINIECGTDILNEYMDAAGGDIVRTLWRYNSGQTSLPREEYKISYANKVLLYMYRIQQMMRMYLIEPGTYCYVPKFIAEGGYIDEIE